MKHLVAVLRLLSRRERWQMVVILMFMLPNAMLQVAGVASVMPFIAVLAQPELVETNSVLSGLHRYMGSPAPEYFLGMLAGAALLLLVLSNALAAFTTWLILRFSHMRAQSLSQKLLANYLGQGYVFFLQRNPSDLTKNIITEINHLVSGYLMPTLQLAAAGAVVVALLTMLLLVDPVLALSVGVVLGGAYGLVYAIFRSQLRLVGRRRMEANARRFKITHETFNAIKDLKVSGREDYYLSRYADASYGFASNQVKHQAIAQLPRYALETMAFGVVLVIALYLTLTKQGAEGALPIIALYAMAGYRMMPALQKLFDSAATLRFAAPVVERMREEMRGLSSSAPVRASTAGDGAEVAPMRLTKQLEISHLGYRYPGGSRTVLDDVSLVIPARTTVALVGESGAGKSTLVDIILGLLEPDSGSLQVDGRMLEPALMPEWRRHIGYVPQSIYLADDTLRRNIALGIPDREIDDEAVIRAARAAAIHDFITTELPQGYDTVTGDRGVRLSGGQRQRVGIARALYSNPDLLILDEATSALDGSTETAVMDAIDRLSGQKTIIMIAHRLATVRNCDCLHLMTRGRLVASGSYEELLATQPEFRRMASGMAAADDGRWASGSM
ncbi:MAG: ATP-binding cassette domain-containing protein [Gammaproteobacteria bacterium]|jgi:ABC-type multidrug transport system fused ATPase/permease subunit|nr:ATP-binding cassette domain-containing protein [Gammaproteobacteria bacterium]